MSTHDDAHCATSLDPATSPNKGEGAKGGDSLFPHLNHIYAHLQKHGIDFQAVHVRVVGAIALIRVKRSWSRPSLRFQVMFTDDGPDFTTWAPIGSYDRKQIGRKDLRTRKRR
jgi:hypothetical protein